MSIIYRKFQSGGKPDSEDQSMWDRATSSMASVFSSDDTDWSKSMKTSDGKWGGDIEKVKAKQRELKIKDDGKWGNDSVTAWEKSNNKDVDKSDKKDIDKEYDSKLDLDAKPQEAGFFSNIFSSDSDNNAAILSGEWFKEASKEDIEELQRKAGLTGDDVDGDWGDGSKKAWMNSLEKNEILDLMEDMSKQDQMSTFGITDELLDRSDWTSTLRKNMRENVTPEHYRIEEAVGAIVSGKKDKFRDKFDKKGNANSHSRIDAMALSTGAKQEHGTYAISSHKPGKDNEKLWGIPFTGHDVSDSTTYYTYSDRKSFVNNMMGQIGTLENWKKDNKGGYQTGYMGGAMTAAGANVIDMGEDENGQFISFYDNNDYIKGSDAITKGFKIYDKVYVKKVGNRWQYKDDRGKWRTWKGNTKQSNYSKRNTQKALDRDADLSIASMAGSAIKGLFKGFSLSSGGIIYRKFQEGGKPDINKIKYELSQSNGSTEGAVTRNTEKKIPEKEKADKEAEKKKKSSDNTDAKLEQLQQGLEMAYEKGDEWAIKAMEAEIAKYGLGYNDNRTGATKTMDNVSKSINNYTEDKNIGTQFVGNVGSGTVDFANTIQKGLDPTYFQYAGYYDLDRGKVREGLDRRWDNTKNYAIDAASILAGEKLANAGLTQVNKMNYTRKMNNWKSGNAHIFLGKQSKKINPLAAFAIAEGVEQEVDDIKKDGGILYRKMQEGAVAPKPKKESWRDYHKTNYNIGNAKMKSAARRKQLTKKTKGKVVTQGEFTRDKLKK